MKRTKYQMHIRAPSDLKAKIEQSAALNRRSLNAEIVYGLEFYAQSIERNEKASGNAGKLSPDASDSE